MQIERIARIALAGLSFASIISSASSAWAVCGDALIDGVEGCDDGNTTMGDGCNQNCQTEAGYVCTGADATKKDLCCFSDAASAYALQGNASLNGTTGEVTLVPNLQQQVGVAWFRQTLDFTRPFKISLRLYLGTRDESPNSNGQDQGADGGSILFQRDPRKLTARGERGAELGAQNLSPVFGVEFDTYNNGNAYNDATMGDEDHVSLFHTRTTPASNHLTPKPVCLNDGPVCQNYEDGKYHNFAVEWTGDVDQHVRVFVDGVLRIDIAKDIVGSYFSNEPTGIYFGFAASTGNSTNLHKFCPAAPQGFTVPRDRDGDGVDDSADQDDDGDGRSDAAETGAVFGTVDPSDDPDRDGIPNYLDPDYWSGMMRPTDCPDVLAPFGACDSLPAEVDFDRDGLPDHLDPDSDGDTVFDVIEDGNVDASKQDVTPPVAMPDGKLDDCVIDPLTGVCAGTRPVPPDTDRDMAIDSRDTDSDDDATLDGVDVARLDPCLPNPASPACGTAQSDADLDTVPNDTDPAPTDPCIPDPNAVACGLSAPAGDRDGDTVTNGIECASTQSCPDSDADGARDFNDTDSDGDAVPDSSDPARVDPCVPDVKAVYCARGDFDQDGVSNGTECPNPRMCIDSNGDGEADYRDPDQDDDQTYDGADTAPRDPCVPNPRALACVNGDLDNDGVLNPADADPRNPCVPDVNALGCTTGDRDADGLSNGFECPTVTACADTDGDMLPDWNDPDSDGDGVSDGDECEARDLCTTDSDGDGVADLRDPDRPEIAGGACSADATGGRSGVSLGWLLTVLLATLVGRRWQRRSRP